MTIIVTMLANVWRETVRRVRLAHADATKRTRMMADVIEGDVRLREPDTSPSGHLLDRRV